MPTIALVTGASRGLGHVTAHALAAAGYTVYGTTRASNPRDDGPVRMLSLELTDPASIRAAVATVMEREGRVDLLVNNAGYPQAGAAEEVSLEEARRQFEANFFGAYQLIQAVLPEMRTRGAGRIVNVSSAAGDIPVPFYGVYGASKAALERLTLSLRAELRPFGVHLSCVTPSSHRTTVEHVLPTNAMSLYQGPRQAVLAAMHETVVQGDDPRNVARAVLRAARSRRPRAQYRVGGDSRAFGVLLRLLPTSALEFLVRKKFSQGAAA